MLRDKAKGSYEAEAGISADTLANRFANMTGIKYNYVLRLTNAATVSNTVKELFVTVTAATAATAAAGGGAT